MKRINQMIFSAAVAAIAIQPACAQVKDENLEQHKHFRGEMMTTLVEQGAWYRDIRSELWGSLGLPEERLLEVLGEIVRQGTGEELNDSDDAVWIATWESAAVAAEKRANTAADARSAGADFSEAALAFNIASYPHNNADEATRLLNASVRNYVKAGNVHRQGRVSRIEVDGDGFTTSALLHLPKGDGPFPVVMWSGGIDVTLVEHGPNFKKYFEPEGVAFVTFDIPGGGLNQGMLLTPGKTSIVHHAVYQAVVNHPQLDSSRVAALSSSGGGVSIVSFAVENPHLKAAVSRCGLVDGPIGDPEKIVRLPGMTLDSWATRVGADPSDVEDIVAKSAGHSLIKSGLLDGKIKTPVPVLAINTHRDPIAMPGDMLATARVSESGLVAFFGRSGHCPKAGESMQFIADFMLDHL